MKALRIALMSLIAVTIVSSAIWAWQASHPFLSAKSADRKVCVNAVVGLDLTNSMTLEEKKAAKQIVIGSVIPAIGPCDLFKVVEIGPQFNDVSTILGRDYDDQMPEPPSGANSTFHRLLSRATDAPGISSEEIHDVARQVGPLWVSVADRREKWTQKVVAAHPPQELGSGFTKFVEGVIPEFSSPDAGSIRATRSNYLIVVGDLREEDRFGLSMPISNHNPLPENLHVLLVYPRDSEHDWNSILARWRKYFTGSNLAIVSFGDALNRKTILPLNPFSSLQDVDRRGYWDFIRLIVPFDTLLVVAALVAIFSTYWRAHRRRATTAAVTA